MLTTAGAAEDRRKVLSVMSDQPRIGWPLNDRLALPADGSCFLELVFEPHSPGSPHLLTVFAVDTIDDMSCFD